MSFSRECVEQNRAISMATTDSFLGLGLVHFTFYGWGIIDGSARWDDKEAIELNP